MSNTSSDYALMSPPFILPERLSSSRRRPASPEERRHKKKTGSSRPKPTTDDLITNLLDSFSSIAPAPDDDVARTPVHDDFSPRYSLTSANANPLTITTTKSSRRSSFSLPFRDGFRPTFAGRPSYSNVHPALRPQNEGQPRQSEDIIEEPEKDDGVAQPPIVPMSSRGLPARSKQQFQSFSKKQRSQQNLLASHLPADRFSRPTSRADTVEQANSRGMIKSNNVSRQLSPVGSVRQRPLSIDTGYSSTSSAVVERGNKGKQPVHQATHTRSSPDASRRNGMIFGANGAPPPVRVTSLSGRSSLDSNGARKLAAGRATSLSLTSIHAISRDSGRTVSLNSASLQSISDDLKQFMKPRTVQVPDRSTSLQKIDTAILYQQRSRDSRYVEDDDDAATVIGARTSSPGDRTPTQSDYDSPVVESRKETAYSIPATFKKDVESEELDSVAGLDDRAKEVMRKIKELKAASQARLGSLDAARMRSAAHSRQVSDEALDYVPPMLDNSSAYAYSTRADRVHEYNNENPMLPPLRPDLKSSPSSGSLSSTRRAARTEMQRGRKPETIGIISTSSSRAPSIDANLALSPQASNQDSSRRSSRWSVSGSRPQTAAGDSPWDKLSSPRTDSLRSQAPPKPVIKPVIVPAPPPETDAPDAIEAEVDAFLKSPRLSQSIMVERENRRISFSEIGDPRGHPVICCIGMGMTRYITAFYDELATSLRLRLITPDRPGIGDSDPHQGGAIRPIDWPRTSLSPSTICPKD